MGVLYVTSLHGGEGKTAFCAGLAHLLGEQGSRPALFKPVRISDSGAPGESAPGESDNDAEFLASLQGALPPEGWPVEVGVQEAQEGLLPDTRERVMAAFQQVHSQAADIVVEGPPMAIAQSGTVAITLELAELLDARVALLVLYSTTLTAEDILGPARALGHRLLGVVLNGVLRYRNHDAQSSLVALLREQGIAVLGVLPDERRLLGVTVGQLAQHLDAEFLLWEEKRDQLVDHLMIGGMVLGSGVHYFSQRETKAVIVRGDRPDIQMAALSTPIRCLVLTGGHRPIQYVEHEAKEEEVPVVLVQSDSLTTAKAVESLFEGATIHHSAKVACFAQLLDQGLDLQAIAPVLGNG